MKKLLNTQFLKLSAKAFAIFAVVFLFSSTKALAGTEEIWPSSFSSAITGGGNFCMGSGAPTLSVNWGNTDCSTSSYDYYTYYDPISINWYQVSTLTNTGGINVQTTNTSSYTTSSTFSPNTNIPGKFYYYVTVSWSAPGYYCNYSSGSITTDPTLMDSVIIYGAIVNYPDSVYCTTNSDSSLVTLSGYQDASYSYLGGTYSSIPSGLAISPVTGNFLPSASAPGTYTVNYAIPANGPCGAENATYTVIINGPPDISNLSIVADSVCQTFSSSVTVNSSSLANGPYTLYYDMTGANTAAGTSVALTMANGSGNFSTPGLNNSGYTTIIIDSIVNGGCAAAVVTGVNALIDVYAPASVTANQITPVYCLNGNNATASAIVTGGQAPFTYAWSNSQTTDTATGLGVGSYTVTVTDNYGCVAANASVTITQIPTLTANTTVDAEVTGCAGGNNGAASVNVSGGTIPYTYLWSNSQTTSSISALTADTYTVSVMDNNGCSTTSSVTITQPAPLEINGNVSFSFVSSADQSWVVPVGVTQISLTTTGGSGGNAYYSSNHNAAGGNGASITGIVNVTPGHTIEMLIGGSGYVCYAGYGGSGGGGTYVWDATSSTLLQVAGGGGGGATIVYGAYNSDNGGDGQTDMSNLNSPTTDAGITCAAGGSGGNGGGVIYYDDYAASGGAGWLSNGATASSYDGGTTIGGFDPANGGAGGSGGYEYISPGGFGGGGGANVGGGGGGGYNGGGGGGYYYAGAGGGGGSYCAGTVTATATNTGNGMVSISYPALPIVTNVTCNNANNGTITINISGGTTPYTYSWAPTGGSNATASNLSAGTYTVTVTDINNCTFVDSATVTQPAVLAITIASQDNGFCPGSASATANAATGGTSPYTYSWAPYGGTNLMATGLSSGSYTITVTDSNSCTATASVTITQGDLLAITPTVNSEISCNGASDGSMSANASSGLQPYTYLWSNSATTDSVGGLMAGTYTVSVTDGNGCSVTGSVNITQPDPLTFVSGSQSFSFISSADQSWVVPAGVTQISLTTTGGSGGNAYYTFNHYAAGGNGATISGLVNVTPGHTIEMLIGGSGYICYGGYGGSGGGGTYVWDATSSTLLQVAGGGGGAAVIVDDAYENDNGGDGQTDMSNLNNPTTDAAVTCATGGSGGNGGGVIFYDYYTPSGGAGWLSNGATASSYDGGTTIGGFDPANGGAGGSGGTAYISPGAYGGGGGANVGGGGGGGYNGGGGGAYVYGGAGGGGGSYCAGSVLSTSTNTGNGAVAINYGSAAPSVTQNVSCFNGNNGIITSPLAAGGTSPYTYQWQPSGGSNTIASNLSAGTYTLTVSDAHGCANTYSVTVTQPTALAISIASETDATCSMLGSATANAATGGVSPYTYLWSDASSQTNLNATGLSSGSYTITVTDSNACTASAAVSIGNTCISVTASVVTNVSCYGGNTGSAMANVTGGTSPFTYLWSNSETTNPATGLTAGSYTVTVTDNNSNSATASVTITQPLTGTRDSIISVTNVGCNGGNGGTAKVGIKGGLAPYTYSWSPNGGTSQTGTGLSAGTYTVTVSNATGCSNMLTVTITQPAAIRDSVVSISNVSCYGQTANVTVGATGGTSPYSYTWTRSYSTTSSATGLSAGNYTVTVKDKFNCTASLITFTITQPAQIRDSIVKSATVNISCNGANNGSATLGIKNGIAPFTYTWTPNVSSSAIASGLSAGTYTVSITDNSGCSGTTTTVTITQPNLLRDSLSSITNVGCYGGSGGSASIGTRGGTSPYTYLWSPGGNTTYSVTGLSGGTYSVTVTDKHGCSGSTITVTIMQPAAPLQSSLGSVTTPTCHGGYGSASINATGGTSPYVYAWSPNVSSSSTCTTLAAGSYTVTVKDAHGCNATPLVITITQPLSIHDTIVSSAKVNVSCNGGSNGSATVGVKYGTSPYTYLWTNGQTTATAVGLSAGTYSVTVTDANGCTSTVCPLTITQPTTALSAYIGSVSCQNNLIKASVNGIGGTSPYTYLWTPSGKTSSLVTGLPQGTYTVTVTDAHGCMDTISKNLICGAIVKDDGVVMPATPACCGGLENISLYPNPNTGQFTITGLTQGMMVEMYDYTGRKVSSITASDITMQLNIADQPNGIYLVRIISKDGTLVSQKKVVKTQ